MKQWIATSTCLYGSVSLKRLRYFWAAMITLSLEGQVPLDCLHPLLNAMLRQIQNVLFFCYRLILCPSFKEPFQWYNKISARGPGWNFEFHALSDISHAVIFSWSRFMFWFLHTSTWASKFTSTYASLGVKCLCHLSYFLQQWVMLRLDSGFHPGGDMGWCINYLSLHNKWPPKLSGLKQYMPIILLSFFVNQESSDA